MTYSILYISSLSKGTTNVQIEELMTTTLNNNLKHDVSGFLIYDKGNFVQLLEGEEPIILNIFCKIKKDSRHQNINVILAQETDLRAFDFYHSGFKIVNDIEVINELKEYVQLIASFEEPKIKKTIHLVEGILNAI